MEGADIGPSSRVWLADEPDGPEESEGLHGPFFGFMKIVLQHLETFEYAHSYAGWTPHVDAAIGFPSVVTAVDYAVRHKLTRVRVAMKFPHAAHNVEFPPVHAQGQAVMQ